MKDKNEWTQWKKKIPKRKSWKGWTEGPVLQGFLGAISLNLLWASMIVKEQRMGESPGRFAFPACPASRQPLFVLLPPPPPPPQHTHTHTRTVNTRAPTLKPTPPHQLKKVEKVTHAAKPNRGEHERGGERSEKGKYREADRKRNESERQVCKEQRKTLK